ncbi:PREDICTED: rho GTPase-activating protein 31 [Nanorana parkeri]|uniref:rho GTPase-activating protein 31 n=1 Tax=Nanorana parkeri TaxID=125878 RepID=UPI000854D7B4|nr:PREDICTED: rho GTPase-activating protein 31 [Nanorana parkeri]
MTVFGASHRKRIDDGRGLRQEFVDQCPDLTKEVYLQDIHCVGSLCKLYFRELPNPLLTFQLYTKFTDAVSCPLEGEQLSRIQNVIQELPPSHYRTLEYLSRHLTHIASFSTTTNMHIRNLALVWAPNLLRCKEIEDSGCNGDAAFLEVRIQQIVIEFILNNVEQIFRNDPPSPIKQKEEDHFPNNKVPECRIVKSMTLPSGSLPMKLVSLEEAQARSLSATHPARKERRENSLPEIVPVTGTLFHTVIDLPENKRKLSTKSKKWKSIFNLGRSGTESKSKLSRNGSVFVRGQKDMGEKATIRPAKSMDSLCSLPAEGEDEKVSRLKRSVGTGGFFIPVLKSRATGTGSNYDVSKQDSEWDGEEVAGATGGSNQDKATKMSQTKQPPEQMKVFRIGDDPENEQNSPKGRKMFYAANDGSSKPGFPGSLFPLEASPRHQRKALNISEPFAVSVPLRVSAVISTNSTPCRASSKDRPLLSSLEELPLMEPDSGPRSPDSNGKSGLKTGSRSPDVTEPVKKIEPRRPCLKDLSPDLFEEDNRTLTLKEILLEMSQLPDILPIAAADRKTVEHTFVSLNMLHEAIESEPSKPVEVDTTKTSPEITPTNDLHSLFPRDQEDDTSITLLDPLWSDIQQELKIIESEEDLSTSTGTPPDSNRAPSPSSQSSEAVKEDSPCDGASELSMGKEILHSLDTGSSNLAEESRNQKENVIPPNTELENDSKLPQETHDCKEQEQRLVDGREPKSTPEAPSEEIALGLLKPVAAEKERRISVAKEGDSVMKSEEVQVISDRMDVSKEDDRDDKSEERKSSESLDNDDDLGGESAHTFELEELWEEHQWVTSPLHSPKLKSVVEPQAPAIPPKRRGTTGELYKRPEFTRSLSLDSKDTRTSQWTIKLSSIKADGGCYRRLRNDQLINQNTKNEPQHGQVKSRHPEMLTGGNEIDSLLKTEDIDKRPCIEPVIDRSWVKDNGPLNTTTVSPQVPIDPLDNLPNVNVQEIKPSTHICNNHQTNENCIANEGSSDEPESQPSSLKSDSSSSSGVIFTFENTSAQNPDGTKHQQIHQSTAITTLSMYDRSKSLNDHPCSHQSSDLDYSSANHAPTGRRNSAPVSVSAVRASFMIKMCQAKAVPVIPPQVQYTQIPQPLQVLNADSEVLPPEKKDCEPDSTPKQTSSQVTGHNDIPKTPKTEVKAVEEKENSDPVSADHSTPNSSSDNNRSVPQDVPVLRRKRTSDGEASGDTPFSSKMDRPSGISKSFRSRPGRPQSLILFSPPFPIMDHPSVDSRILLTPIKSPTQSTPQESAGENQRTPDGVILRNKMTIPKNGQRLETSTSCFYQPQRRSVILDSRSGRQIE